MTYERDLDLIRDILIEIESGRRSYCVLSKSEATALMIAKDDTLDDAFAKKLSYHLGLIEQAGFAEFQKTGGGMLLVEGLTWQGHEFLNNIRPLDIWDHAKEHASSLGGFSMELVADLAKGLIKTKVAKHTGIEL